MSSVTTWFQVNVNSCASRSMAGFFERQRLGMFYSFIAVKALTNNNPILHNDGANHWIWLYLTFTSCGERKREIKKILVAFNVINSFHVSSYSKFISLRSIETISISRIGRRSDPRV